MDESGTSSLFRREAVLNSASPRYGSIIVSTDRASTSMALLAIIVAAALFTLLSVGTYSRKEQVSGYLVPRTGLIQVASPRVGIIVRVDVSESELVQEGAPLFVVAAPRATFSAADVDQIHIDRLQDERRSIESRIERERALSVERRAVTNRKIAALERELKHMDARREIAAGLSELAGRDVTRLESLLASGHVANSLLDARRAEVLKAQEALQALDLESERVIGEIESLQSAVVQLPLELGVRLEELQARLVSLQRQSAEADAQKAITVRTQVAGRVSAVMAHVGKAVTPDRHVLSIVPVGDELQAELLVPTRAAGFVRQGQEVRLRYDAFPYQKFGLHGGSVSSISQTVLNPEDQTGPVRLAVPAYKVVARLESQTVTAYGDELHLQPGLTLQADLVRDRRRIIEWIFDPLLAATLRI